MCAARTTKLPVMCAVKSPLRPRKPMTSAHPAVRLSTTSSACTAGELLTDGANTNAIGALAAGDTVPDHLARVDDLVEARLVDITGLERGLFQAQVCVVRLVRDFGRLVIADHRAERGHQHQRAADHLVDALLVEPGSLDRETPQLVASVAQHTGGMQEIIDDDR